MADKSDSDSTGEEGEEEKKRTGGWYVHGHCCLVRAGSPSAAAARWRGAPPPGERSRDEPPRTLADTSGPSRTARQQVGLEGLTGQGYTHSVTVLLDLQY